MKSVLFLVMCITYFPPATSSKSALRILDGRAAQPGEFPFAVRLEQHSKSIYPNETKLRILTGCSGSAIKPTWILTAAHCTTTDYTPVIKNMSGYILKKTNKIRYGSPHLKPSENHQVASILSARRHMSGSRPATNDDIALLHTEPLLLGSYARVSGVEYTALVGREVTLVGFGRMRAVPHKYEFDFTSTLDTPLQVIDRALLIKCPKGDKDRTMKLCMVTKCGSFEYVGAADSGSPALLDSSIVAVAVMVTDMFYQETRPSLNRVANFARYTPVSLYADWIHSVVANE